MASAFGHAFVVIALGTSFSKEIKSFKFWFLGIICAILPDADVIGFQFHVAYESFWGHRGFSHSLVFALLLGCFITAICYTKLFLSKKGITLIVFFFLCTASHAIFDALTTGGLGVAFFSPFNDTRYFFPWRPIQVSPIGIKNFIGTRGVNVLLSEAKWIGIPCGFYILLIHLFKRIKT